MQWVFETLGIDKQADVSTVRKAYAKALKQCDQATEADRFQRIRQAYEFALQWAKQREATAPATPPVATPITTQQPDAAHPPAQTTPAQTAAPASRPEFATPAPREAQPLARGPAEPPYARPADVPTPATAPPVAQPPATPLPQEPQPLVPRPSEPPYARPAGTPASAFAPPPTPRPLAPQGSPPPAASSWQAKQPPVEPQPLRPAPILSRPPAAPPAPHVDPFKANDQKGASLPPGHALMIDDAQASAKAVLREFLIEARKPNGISLAAVLTRYTNDERLTSLDAKAEFEQGLLDQIFAGPVDTIMLDAACDLFAWETSNRHLGTRPNLVQRMLRQQSLRHLLAAYNSVDQDLHWAVRVYTTVRQQPEVRAEPWEIIKTNRLLDRFAGYKQELGERYNAEAFEWWRQKLTSNPTLLASYQENKPAAEAPPPLPRPVPRRSQRTTQKRGTNFFFLWPLLAIFGAIASHFPSNNPNDQSNSYISSTPISSPPRKPAPPAPPTTNPYLMGIDQLRHAAEQGDATAQNFLAVRYQNGSGIPQDADLAAYWFQRAAAQGFPEAQYRLGELYKKGTGVPRNIKLAVEWWQKSAMAGNALAQDSLAEMYAKGDGVKKDYQAAYRWWQKAALNGIPNAETGIGWLYENGYGVPRDVKAAIDWYRKAAAHGDITGQINLALMYEHGDGVPADPVIADALLTVATQRLDPYTQGSKAWADIDRVSAQFTPAQRSASDMIARDLSSSSNNFLAVLDRATHFRHPTSS
jgi:hypothetical protein